jgi:polysaccharide export outer membrane protein
MLRVTDGGRISFPLIGEFQVAGLSEQTAASSLARALAGHVRDPQVSVEVVEFGGHQISVLGAVATPGKVALRKGRSSLVDVLGEAGGVSEKVGNFVTIIPASMRNSQGLEASLMENSSKREGFELPLPLVLGLMGSAPLEVPLEAGDVVVVQPAGSITVEGEVEHRGAFSVTDNFTLVGALAAAGGITYGANFKEIEVVRNVEDVGSVSLIFDLEKISTGEEQNLLLKNGDVVRVPSDSGKRFSQDVFRSIQGFIRFGGILPF